MASTTTKQEDTTTPKAVPAGADDATLKAVKAEGKEIADDEAPAFVVTDEDDEGLTKLPEGAVLDEPEDTISTNARLAQSSLPPNEFEGDEHFGQGGTFRIDDDTGLRVPVYEKFVNTQGKERFRQKP